MPRAVRAYPIAHHPPNHTYLTAGSRSTMARRLLRVGECRSPVPEKEWCRGPAGNGADRWAARLRRRRELAIPRAARNGFFVV